MRKIKLMAGVAALLMTASVFAGCNGGSNNSTASSTPASSTPASSAASTESSAASSTAPTEVVSGAKTNYSISICGINLEDGMNAILKTRSEGYNTLAANQLKEAFPDVDITFNAIPWDNASGKIQTLLMSNGTDLFTQGGAFIPEYYKEGLTQSLNPFIEKDTTFVYEDNYPASFRQNLNCTDYSGKELLTLPWQVGYRLIIYDKQLFDEWGVEYLSENPTPEEILEKASKMTGTNPVSGIQNYGAWFDGKSLNMSYLIAASEHFDAKEVEGDYSDPKNLKWNLNSEGFVKTLQWAVDLAEYVPDAAATTQGYENFGKENNDIAICIDRNGGVIMGEYYLSGNEDLIERFVPTMHLGHNGGNWTPVDGMGMNAMLQGADADMAWEILKFMCGPVVMEWQYTNHGPMAIPHKISEQIYNEKDRYLRKNAEVFANATHPGYEINPFYGSTLQPSYASMISRAIAGEKVDVQKELDDLQEKAVAWSASK